MQRQRLTHRFAPPVAVLMTAGMIVGCDELHPPLAPLTEARPPLQFGLQSMSATLDDDFVGLAEQVSGFGGLFLHPQTGAVIVYLQDLGRIPEARLAITRYLGQNGARNVELFFKQADFDFGALATWRRRIDAAELPFLTMSDVDEAQNRILVGVNHPAAVTLLTEMLDAWGIPPAALVIRVLQPVSLDLQAMRRPMVGGVQVKALPRPPGEGECTLGFVAVREYPGGYYDFGGPRYIMTNSHCTTTFGTDNNDIIGQPDLNQAVGVEYSDPPLVSNAQDPACPSSFNVCRRSDAALFELIDNSNSFSTFEGVATATGLTYTGRVLYDGKQQGFAANLPVRKIGRSSGETSGHITNTCVTVPIQGRQMVCQMYATYWSRPGDSGSPVWFRDVNGKRWIVGIHWGRNRDLNVAVFSMWMDAVSEIGNDILAQSGQQWWPALTIGPANFSLQ